MNVFDPKIIHELYRPLPESHKGQNGRLLVIGGSELFHAAIFWSAQVASKIVDLVHFTSPANENNELVRKKIKEGFWEGIVVDFSQVKAYVQEDDCILIGPGMERGEVTRQITNDLLVKYPGKRWVVDGGALQEVEPELLNGNMIITPHQGEWMGLLARMQNSKRKTQNHNLELKTGELEQFSKEHQNLTILLKGQRDWVCRGGEVVEIAGGNPGMTKGGTGDVLAGLTAALYCKNDPALAGQAAAYVNKKAGESLAQKMGNYFNAGDLVMEAPVVLARVRERGA